MHLAFEYVDSRDTSIMKFKSPHIRYAAATSCFDDVAAGTVAETPLNCHLNITLNFKQNYKKN